MTPEEQRVRIAEWCGWTGIKVRNFGRWGMLISGHPQGDEEISQPLPDYCNDLNAMHAAEKWLFQNHGDLWSHYITAIERITGSLSSIHATASQRATALCRLLHPDD